MAKEGAGCQLGIPQGSLTLAAAESPQDRPEAKRRQEYRDIEPQANGEGGEPALGPNTLQLTDPQEGREEGL